MKNMSTMKKLSSSLLLLLSIVILMLSAGKVHANRAAAGDLAYSYLRKDSTVKKIDSIIIRVDTTKSPTGTVIKIDTVYRFDTTFNFFDVYRMTYNFYRDCSGATAEPGTVKVCFFNSCNADQGSVDLPKKTPLGSNGGIVGNGCLPMPLTTCTNPASTIKGFRKWVYEGEVSLPSKCAQWRFVVSITARNLGITNYTAPAASNNMFSEATLNNVIAANSSSPAFNLELIQYMCAGNKHNYAYTGVDADGDILEYSLIDPSTGADNQTTCVIPPFPSSYTFLGSLFPGTSLTSNPFVTTPPLGGSFSLSSTGVMTFSTPALPAQQALMTLLVTKRRGVGGPVVGTVTRDMEFIISTGCASSPINFSYNKPASTATILWAGTPVDTAILCPDDPYHICFDIQSPDPALTFSNVTDNHLTFSPTSASSTLPSPYTGEGTNHISNCFDWTPTPADEGTKYLVVKSEVCKPGNPKFYRLDTIFLEIIRTAYIETNDTFICFGELATLEGFSQGGYGWELSTGGTLGIISPFAKITDVAPSATTTYYLRDSGIRGICARKDNPTLLTNQAEVKVVVVNPKIDAGPDTVMCSYSSLQLNANLLNPQPELTYKYQWSPGKWLTDSTLPNPVLRFPAGTPTSSIPDSITFILKLTPYPDSSCVKYDTMKVDILKGFYILTGDTLAGNTGLGHEGRQKGVSDTIICKGQTITLLGWGDPRYNYIWNPASGVSTPTDFKPGMTITPADTGDLVFSLTAARAGCPDSTKQVRIRIDPNPTVTITDDQTICFGDTINLYADITPDVYTFTKYKFNWAPGGALARADTFFTYFTGYRTEKIVFTVTTPAGCFGKDSAVYTVLPRFFLTPSLDTSICPGDSAQIHVVGDAKLQSVIWKPTTNIDSILSLNPIVNPVFTTDYVVIGLDSNRCVDSATVKVTVYPRALIYLPDTAKIYPGEIYQLDPQGNSLYYTWFPPIGLDNPNIANPKAQPLLNTMYTVKGISDAGCAAVDSIYIFVAPDSYIDVPNAFVPGRTDDNNVFKPVHLGDATLKSFTIYNRWGLKLFESNDINKGWDGSYGGQPQPFGVYVYVLEAVTAKGKVITKQGNVTLVR